MDVLADNGLSPRSHVVRQLIVVFSSVLLLALVLGLFSLYRLAGALMRVRWSKAASTPSPP